MIEKNEMIFGVRAVIEAIQAGKEIDKVLIKKDIQSDLSKELFAVLKDTFIPRAACTGGTHQPHHQEEPSGSGGFYLAHHLPAYGRHRAFLV